MEFFENYLKGTITKRGRRCSICKCCSRTILFRHNKELFLSTLKEAVVAKGGITKISKEAHINNTYMAQNYGTCENGPLETIILNFKGSA